jgi:hypothetical protein
MDEAGGGAPERSGGTGSERREGETRTLRLAGEEGRRTLERQTAVFEEIDAKNLSVLRFDLAVATLFVSLLAAATGAEMRVDPFLNPYTGLGVALLLVSAALAGVGYTVSARVCGVRADELERATGMDPRTFRRRLVGGYAAWIRRNRRVNRRVALFGTAAVLSLLAGVALLALGAWGGLLGGPPPLVVAATLLGLAGVLVLSGFAGGLGRAVRTRGEQGAEFEIAALDEEPPPFDGEVVTTGRAERTRAPEE